MSAYIKYNSFVFPDPQPYVSVDEEMVEHGGIWSIEKTISLDGKITGDSDTTLYQKRYDLIMGLSQSFKKFLVLENTSGYLPVTAGTITDPHGYTVGHTWPGDWTEPGFTEGADVIVSGDFTRVDSIEFDDSRYAGDGGVLGYSVSLACMNTEDFSSGYYIVDPTDEVEYSESEGDGIIEVSHSISAKGINTSASTSDAMNNAKTFVQSRTGISSFPGPTFITGKGGAIPNHSYMILDSQSESIDRIGNTYSIDETWRYDPSGAATNSIQKYTFTYSSGAEDDYLSADASLTINGGLTSTMSSLRAAIPSLSDIREATTGAVGHRNLSTLPGSYSVSEDANARTIGISVSFDNNDSDYSHDLGSSGPATFFDYEVSIDEDLQRNQSTVSIQGDLKVRRNQLYSWNQMKAYFDTNITEAYLYNIAQAHYVDILGTGASGSNSPRFTLNPKSKSYSVSEKSGDPSISVSMSFSDEDFVVGYPAVDYDISCTPSIRRFKPAPSALHNGQYLVSYLGYYNREKIGFNLNLTRRREATDLTFDMVDYMGGKDLLTGLRELTTGKGFQKGRNLALPKEAQMFNPIDFRRPGKGFDNYGVRLETESFSTDESSSPKISYNYEFTKPANAGTESVQIELQGNKPT